jgi:molybdopterin synthase sulfur carrier subunit
LSTASKAGSAAAPDRSSTVAAADTATGTDATTPHQSCTETVSTTTTRTTVTVRLFAALRDQAGWGERRLSLDHTASDPLTPQRLWSHLGLGPGSLPPPLRVAVNHAFATDATALREGDEVAFLPPISGG